MPNRGDEDFDGQLGTRLAGCRGSLDVAEVTGGTLPFQARPIGQDVEDFLQALAGLAKQDRQGET